MSARRFLLSFEGPRHGWLGVELSGPDGGSSLDASDVPGDSLTRLASAASDLLRGDLESRVTWYLEPVEATWVFLRVGDDVRVCASVGGEERQLIGVGTERELALLIWRAMRKLETSREWTTKDAERVWSHPFPHREVLLLGQALRALVPLVIMADLPPKGSLPR